MSNYAKVDNSGIVIDIIYIDDKIEKNHTNFLKKIGGNWIQASFNTYAGKHKFNKNPLRKNYPSIGYFYDKARDAFIPPQPYNSWKLDEDTCQWVPPVNPTKKPDEALLIWNEAFQQWEEL